MFKVEQKNKKKMPAGMIVLVIFFILLALGSLINLINSWFFVFGIYLSGAPAIILHLIFLAIETLIIIGIFKKYKWTKPAILVYLGFFMVNLIIEIILFFIDPETTINLSTQNISQIPLTLFSVLYTVFVTVIMAIYVIFFIYVLKKKGYFTQ